MTATVTRLDRQDIQKIADETLDNEAGVFSKDKLRVDLDAALGSPSQAVILANAHLWFERLKDKCIDAAISRKANIKTTNKSGQIDYLAYSEQLIRLGDGQYVHTRDADVFALDVREDNQRENMERAVASYHAEKNVRDAIRAHMVAHDVATAGEALCQMGYL